MIVAPFLVMVLTLMKQKEHLPPWSEPYPAMGYNGQNQLPMQGIG